MRSDMVSIRHLRRSVLGLLFLLSLTQICDAQITEGRIAAALSRRDGFIRLVNSIRTSLSERHA